MSPVMCENKVNYHMLNNH